MGFESDDDGEDYVWADYDGYIVAKTDRAIGIGSRKHGSVEFWLPVDFVGHVTYRSPTVGDSPVHFLNTAIEAIEMKRWLAVDRGLVA